VDIAIAHQDTEELIAVSPMVAMECWDQANKSTFAESAEETVLLVWVAMANPSEPNTTDVENAVEMELLVSIVVVSLLARLALLLKLVLGVRMRKSVFLPLPLLRPDAIPKNSLFQKMNVPLETILLPKLL